LGVCMNLSSLFPLVHDAPGFVALVEDVKGSKRRTVVVPSAAKPFVVAALHSELGLPALVIAAHPEGAKHLCDQLESWLGDAAAQLFPEPDALPYERIPVEAATMQQRIKALSLLSCGDQAPLVVASAHAVAHKTICPSDLLAATHVVGRGSSVDPKTLLDRWNDMGYEWRNTVEVPGTFSRRGGILDIYPPSAVLPSRIELFGNDVESIRLFDPWTQRSVGMVDSVTVVPAREDQFSGKGLKPEDVLGRLDLSQCNLDTRLRFEREIGELLGGGHVEGQEYYAPLLGGGSIVEHLPEGALLILDQPGEIEQALAQLDEQAREIRDEQTARRELPPGFPMPYYTWAELVPHIERLTRRLTLQVWQGEPGEPQMAFSPAPTYGGRLGVFVKDVREMARSRQRVIIVSRQARRLSELLEESDVIAPPLPQLGGLPPEGSVSLIDGSLAQGWLMDSVALFTDHELFGFTKKRRRVRRYPMQQAGFLSDLTVGDYVVHIEHGIARFAGTTKMKAGDSEREYLVLEYAAGDRLYVPSEQIDRVGRYIGPSGRPPALSRLGTQEWARAKQRVRERAGELARELLALYATREVVSGVAFSADTTWQEELEASFPYLETPDQVRATVQIKEDMERARPMDRLVCGDVGYGKTELAIRAAFKAVMEGAQVAMLVPTTVLAQQHFQTFTERLGAFPVNIEVLSRFRSEREQREVIEGLKRGSVDIVIGTHRLLQKDVSFKNLALVIVDEEQRFGVVHKEYLKQMRREVDVLTLTATPIPRTLHMALSGVRDMSTVETPPEERLPIKTYVAEYNERLVREAILRELDRGGQVFFVHNRVHSIYRVASQLAELVPEAEVAVAHGQMAEEQLESVMLDFSQGKTDILVSTTIIESGLDIPNVNTLVVNDADKLGLGQLYQLRGRVGRSANRAYAYFLYGKGKTLSPQAMKRLETIFQATELGAGFRIAMRDLEIRGAGNLLGAEQSGHIGAVGFDLYCRLLQEAVDEARGSDVKRVAMPPSPTIDLPIRAYIPEGYVPDLDTRLTIYQRLAKSTSIRQVDEMGEELADRFGTLPRQLRSLLYAVRLKILAVEAGVESVVAEEGHIVVRMVEGAKLDKGRLPSVEGVKVGTSQARLNVKQLGAGWREVLEDTLTTLAFAAADA